MGENLIRRPRESLCVNAEKVYDWVIEEGTGSTTLLASRLPVAIPADATNVQVKCILTDENGIPLPINTQIDVTEVAPREDRQFDLDGTIVTLQRVLFTKKIYIVLEISGVDSATGSQFFITSDPFPPFNFTETEYLCAPPGTTLIVRISDFSCQTVVNRTETDAISGFGVSIFICQSIQVVAPVTIELSANFCVPRETLSEHCGNPRIPPQCPIIFPGRSPVSCDE